MEKQTTQQPKAAKGQGAFEWYEALISAALVLVLIFSFFFRIIQVDGESMVPTLQNGEKLIVWGAGYEPQRGDVVIVDSYTPYGKPLVKRVIAKGGDTICIDYETGTVVVNGEVLREDYIAEPTYLGYDANALKADLRSQVMGEVNRYRYKNADLLIRGVRDFLKGIDWLEQTDAEALHKEIMAYGYKAQPVDQLDVPFDYSRYLYATKEEEKNKGKLKKLKVKLTRNGWLVPPTRENTVVSMMHMTAYNAYRVQKVLNYDSNSQKGFVTERSKEEYSRCVREMKACMKEIDAQFDAAAQSYRERCGEVRSLDFWKKYLNLDK